MDFDPELFGAAIGEMLKEQREALEKQIQQMGQKVEGMQSKLDKCMSYAGDWQQALDYPPGSTVRRGSELYVATRHIKSGGNLSAREGSGWQCVTKGE